MTTLIFCQSVHKYVSCMVPDSGQIEINTLPHGAHIVCQEKENKHIK